MAEPHSTDYEVEPDVEVLGGLEGERIVDDLIARELGPEMAQTFARIWRVEEEWKNTRDPDEGLRERKKRLTRQRISDVATTLFIARGFDSVRVSEIAEMVGVSEKTVYNYFPTKESLVFDQTEAELSELAQALRERGPGVSPTRALVDALKNEALRHRMAVGNGNMDYILRFGEMVRSTPSLRAAWSDHRHSLVEAATAILAADAGVDPRDPEPLVAARALVSIQELFYESYVRRLTDGLDGDDLHEAVVGDLERAARLLDTGLWSLNALAQGAHTKDQLRDATLAAQTAHKQVVVALREARKAWNELRAERAGERGAASSDHARRRAERMAEREQRTAGKMTRGAEKIARGADKMREGAERLREGAEKLEREAARLEADAARRSS
jgi:AcrR family transcriptional regulator